MFLKDANSSILCRKPATNWYFPQQAFLIFSYVWQQWDYAQLFRLMCLRRKNKHHTYHYPKCSRIAASSLQFCCIRSDFLYDIESSLWFLSPARENYTKECFSLFFPHRLYPLSTTEPLARVWDTSMILWFVEPRNVKLTFFCDATNSPSTRTSIIDKIASVSSEWHLWLLASFSSSQVYPE